LASFDFGIDLGVEGVPAPCKAKGGIVSSFVVVEVRRAQAFARREGRDRVTLSP